MPATTNKQRLLSTVLSALKKHYEPPAADERPVLDQLLYAIVRENAPRDLADRAFADLQKQFYDWNEVRVSSPHEIAAVLGELPQSLAKAQRIISLLQELFETNYSFDLEQLPKKGIKPAARQLARYQASSDFAVAWVTQHVLDGHAIPLDAASLRTLKRLGMIDEDSDDLAAIQSSLEHQVPKAKASLFVELISGLAHDRCGEEPRCHGCALKAECVHGSARPADSNRKPKPR